MKKFILAATAVMAVTSQSANAGNDWPYWYVGLNGGANIQTDADWDKSDGTEGDFSNDTGYTLSASLGYRPHNTATFLDSSRIELEGSYRKNSFNDAAAGDANVQATAGTLNYYLDLAPEAGVNPYIGAGLGYGTFEIDGGNVPGANGKKNEFVYQLMAGLGFQFEELPRTELTIGYRYFAPFSDPDIGANPGSDRVEFEYDSHTVEAGARFRF